MSQFISEEERKAFIEKYNRDGYISPINVLPKKQIDTLYEKLLAFEASRPGGLPMMFNAKVHLLFPWLWELVHDSRILEPVSAVLGPDVLCWASSFFTKKANTSSEVPWHQDGTYWGITEPRALTAWLAFTPSNSSNGGMCVIPGTQNDIVPHHRTSNPNSMLPAREEVSLEIPQEQVLCLDLEPGQMSLHHVMTLHGSEKNTSVTPRVGFAIRYIAADLKQKNGQKPGATLVAGKDHSTFELEEAPESDMDPRAIERYYAGLRKMAQAVFPERNTGNKGTF